MDKFDIFSKLVNDLAKSHRELNLKNYTITVSELSALLREAEREFIHNESKRQIKLRKIEPDVEQ